MMISDISILVHQSQKQPIVNGLCYIKYNYFPIQKVLDDNNKLCSGNTIDVIKNHLNGTIPISPNEINTYISASSISHLIDAWGYLSASISSLLNGNKSVAIHLAYYSELRAVMSFLASEGIGVFNHQHLGVYSDVLCDGFKNGMGTHSFAWAALKEWCNSPSKHTSDLLKSFKVKGKNFDELLSGFVGATAITTSNVIRNWLISWAFDIMKFTSDREVRNIVSYRPQAGQEFTNLISFKDIVDKVYQLFFTLSPMLSDPFHYLDRLLLRKLFLELNNFLLLSDVQLKDRIENTFISLGLSLDPSLKALLFSEPPYNKEELIFSESKKLIIEALPIISRAILLLRMSTGKISLLLEEAGISKNDIEFIWEKYGFNYGLWSVMYKTNELYKLWIEIEQTHTELLNQINPMNDIPYTIRSGVDEDLNRLTQFNRAVLWGL